MHRAPSSIRRSGRIRTPLRIVSTSLTGPLGLLMMEPSALRRWSSPGCMGLSHRVAQRSGEMALRLALGATGSQIFRLIVRRGGSPCAALLSDFRLPGDGPVDGSYVYEVSAGNWMVPGKCRSCIGSRAWGGLPSARRASTTEPARALRSAVVPTVAWRLGFATGVLVRARGLTWCGPGLT